MCRKTNSQLWRTLMAALLALVSLAQSLPGVQATDSRLNAAQAASLELFLSANPRVYGANGDIITFTYEITNNGSVPMAGPFSVIDDKLGLISPCGTGPLAPGSKTSCSKLYAITSTDMDFEELRNSARVDDTGSNLSFTSNEIKLERARRELDLLPSADRSTFSALGDLITFKFEIINRGNVPLTALSEVRFTTDKSQIDLGPISPCGTAPLAPKTPTTPTGSTSCTKAYAVTQTDIDLGSVTVEPYAKNPNASDSCTFCNNKVIVTFAPTQATNPNAPLFTTSPNPSTRLQSVTFKATVTAASGTPTGTVTFLEGSTKLATGQLDANGVATALNPTPLAVGSHVIVARYEGNSKFNPRASAPVTQTVIKENTKFDLLTGSAPVALGAPFTFTVRLLPASTLQTGNVKFLHEGTVIGTVPLKDITDPGSGTKLRGADFITNTFPSGFHTVWVVYEGDSNFNGATSSPVIKNILGQQNTTLELRSSPNPATVGQKVTLTARVLPQADRQTGTVTFFDGATAIFTSTLQNGCVGSGLVCREAVYEWLPTAVNAAGQSPSALTANPHIISARYNGDPNYKAVTTATPVTQTISSAPVVAVTPLTLTVTSGNKAMQLKWNVINDATVTDYRILRNAGINDRSRSLAENWPNTTFSDSENLVTGLTYCYQVEARRKNGTVAATSLSVCKVFGVLELYVPNTLGRPGETVRVSVNITNADGLRIASSDIWLDFNGAILEFVAISRTALTSDYTLDKSVQESANSPTTKRLRVAFINTQPAALKGPGALFWLFFKVKGQAGKTSPLDLRELITNVGGSSIQDSSNPSQDVPLRLIDGLFSVGTATAGFALGDVDGDGSIRAKDALRALSLAVGKPQPTEQERRAGDVNSNNRIDSGDASMILTFAARGNFPLPPKQATVSASTLQTAAVLRLSSAQAQPGEKVLITLGADNLAQVAGGDFQITYDPNVVKGVINVTPAGLTTNFAVDFRDSGNGLLTIALSDDAEISGSGDLLTIELEVQSSAALGSSPLTLADASLNDLFGRDFVSSFANNQLTRQSGTITVTNAATGSAVYLPVVSKR